MTVPAQDPVVAEIAAAERTLEYLRNQLASHERSVEKIRQQIAGNERHLARLQAIPPTPSEGAAT